MVNCVGLSCSSVDVGSVFHPLKGERKIFEELDFDGGIDGAPSIDFWLEGCIAMVGVG